jgi:hypothetical protein
VARTVNGLGDRLLNVQAKTAHALAKPETRLQDGYMAWTVYSNDRFRRCASHSCSAELLYYAEKFCNLGILPLSNVVLTFRLKALFDRFHSFLLASLQKAIPDFTALSSYCAFLCSPSQPPPRHFSLFAFKRCFPP